MIIKEFLPNPVGSDKGGEYIKIFNDSERSVDLAGWKVSDASKKEFVLSGVINSKQELVLFSTKTKISLNNNGEAIFLVDPKEILIDELRYSGVAEEGRIIKQEMAATKPQFENGQVVNSHFSPSIGKIMALDIFLGIILGIASVYIILQLEKRLGMNLF